MPQELGFQPYNPSWIDSTPEQYGLPPLPQKTLQELEAFGFPQAISRAFIETAETLQCVVMSRAPGGGCTDLIQDRYDLKSFMIKAKSCDWGPMSGFVCAALPFNKDGSKKIEYNRGYFDQYLKKIKTVYRGPGDPWLPLTITGPRLVKLNADFKQKAYPIKHSDRQFMLAFDQERSVLAEICIAPRNDATGLLDLFYGRVFYRPYEESSHYGLWREEERSKLPVRLDEKIQVDPKIFDSLYGALPAPQGGWPKPEDGTGLQYLRPILGVRNPHPPYKYPDPRRPNVPDLTYKNAVSGDYDLFAVWPIAKTDEAVHPRIRGELTAVSEKYLIRLSDRQPTYGGKLWPLFVPTAEKAYTLQSNASPLLFLEFVPGFAEIGPLEHDEIGNINGAVLHAANWLNAFVHNIYNNPGAITDPDATESVAANVAFHSDEGGRPGINDIDYKFVAFAPRSIDWKGERFGRLEPGGPIRPVLVENDSQFASLICATRHRCLLTMHYIWLDQLCRNNDAGVQRFMRDLLIRTDGTAGDAARSTSFARLRDDLKTGAEQQVEGNKKGKPPVPIGPFMKRVADLTLAGN
jgi:Anthrax toxin LF subunit